MSNYAGDRRPRGLKPVQRIELDERSTKRQWILLAVFIVIALVAFGYGIHSFLVSEKEPQTGWHVIDPKTDASLCGDDFIFNYCWEKGGTKEDYQRLVSLYAEAIKTADRLFCLDGDSLEDKNLKAINASVNEEIEIDAVLYRALEPLVGAADRYLYMAPLHVEYRDTFLGNGSAPILGELDPYENAETAAYYAELAAFVRDPEAVRLELLGNNRVRLFVSQAYLDFAEAHAIDVFVDLFRLRNAVIVDYFADVLTAGGFTYGSISSYDGYVRNLDTRDNDYAYNLFDRIGNEVGPVARLGYRGATSIVYLRNHPLGEQDARFFYLAFDRTVPPYVAPLDGKYRTAFAGLVSLSETHTCTEIALRLMPIYVAETADEYALNALVSDGIRSAWCLGNNNAVRYNHESLKPQEIFSYDDATYSAVFVK
jgi:hypothetical protein